MVARTLFLPVTRPAETRKTDDQDDHLCLKQLQLIHL